MSVHVKYEYNIEYSKSADKFFKSHENVRKQYKESIQKLIEGIHPETVDVKRIKGKHSIYFRMRIGKWRIIYTMINEEIVVITTLLAELRGDIYKKMDGLK